MIFLSLTRQLRITHSLLILLIISSVFSGCDKSERWNKVSGAVWNTLYSATWQGDPTLSDSIIPAINPIDESLSVFNPNSLVNTVNSSIETPVDSLFEKIYSVARMVSDATDGMYDPTVAPAVEAWGFGIRHSVTTDTLRCDSIREFTGISKTSLKNHTLYKDDIRTSFNFSSIAKGLGCDMVASMFRRNGVENFIIEIGGEIYTSGRNNIGEEWRIAIETPIPDARHGEYTSVVITLSNKAVATSGNYRNFHEYQGTQFGHTISPLTCRPIKTDVVSATVVADNCMLADALATACMTLPSEKAMKLAIRFGVPVILINDKGRFITNKEFDNLIINQ